MDKDEFTYTKDDRCMVKCPMICSAAGRCPVCTPGSPEFDGRGYHRVELD